MPTRKKKSTTPRFEVIPIERLIPDDKNANLGTPQGQAVIEDSLNEDGAGRGILLDKNLRIIAGNKTIEAAVDRGFKEIVLVHGQGDFLVGHVRDNVDLDSPQGRRMAITDNRAGELNLNWSADMIKGLQGTFDFSKLWNQDQMDALLKRAPTLDDLGDRHGAGSKGDLYVTVSLHVAPDTRAKLLTVLQGLPGEDDNDRLIALLESIPR